MSSSDEISAAAVGGILLGAGIMAFIFILATAPQRRQRRREAMPDPFGARRYPIKPVDKAPREPATPPRSLGGYPAPALDATAVLPKLPTGPAPGSGYSGQGQLVVSTAMIPPPARERPSIPPTNEGVHGRHCCCCPNK